MFGGYEFDLSGGRLPLDFANTLSRTSGDHLSDYDHLVWFARQSGLLDEPTAHRLLHDGRSRPQVAAAVLARAITLRGALFALFSAAVHDRPAPPDALNSLNAELARSLPHARLVAAADGCAWSWDDDPAALDRPLWPIARAAADLLTDTTELSRVRLCASDNCDWLFLDLSKNRSRQWCSMQGCGNRAKARRFYQRKRSAAAS